jgi:hypothetical protein
MIIVLEVGSTAANKILGDYKGYTQPGLHSTAPATFCLSWRCIAMNWGWMMYFFLSCTKRHTADGGRDLLSVSAADAGVPAAATM